VHTADGQPFEPGQLVLYFSHQTGLAGVKGWVPAIFAGYPHGRADTAVHVRKLARSNGPVFSRQDEILRIDPELISAARSWIADCEWADTGPDDVAGLTDAEVVRGIQRHYQGGWLRFVADGAQLPPMKPDYQ
jgi:hypothetical protein